MKNKNGSENISEIPEIIKFCQKNFIDELRLYSIFWNQRIKNYDGYYIDWNNKGIIRILSEFTNISTQEISKYFDLCLNELRFQYAQVKTELFVEKLKIVLGYNRKVDSLQDINCLSCPYRDNCQESQCVMRISSSGNIKGCLLGTRKIDFLHAIRNNTSFQDLRVLYKEGFSLIPRGWINGKYVKCKCWLFRQDSRIRFIINIDIGFLVTEDTRYKYQESIFAENNFFNKIREQINDPRIKNINSESFDSVHSETTAIKNHIETSSGNQAKTVWSNYLLRIWHR